MKTLLALLLLIPSLSWGLTFKDGKQVDEDKTFEINKQTLTKGTQNSQLVDPYFWG